MTQTEYSQSTNPPPKTRAEKCECIAFTFCRAATILLVIHMLQLSRFALPIVAGVTTLLYIAAYIAGQKSSRCILGKPIIIATFWGVVSLLSLYFLLFK